MFSFKRNPSTIQQTDVLWGTASETDKPIWQIYITGSFAKVQYDAWCLLTLNFIDKPGQTPNLGDRLLLSRKETRDAMYEKKLHH